MDGRHIRLVAAIAVAALTAVAAPVCAWELVMPDTVLSSGPALTLGELAAGPVPAAAADLVVCGEGRPGTAVGISRPDILRRLVTAGLARDVRFRGPDKTIVVFGGRTPAPLDLHEAVRRCVQRLVPPAGAGAPASWIELELPRLQNPVAAGWRVATERTESLQPGRNLVRCELDDGERSHAFTATVVLHAFGETATAKLSVARDTGLAPDHFTWTWRDLCGVGRDLVVGRDALAGASSGRTIAAGDALRLPDLKPTPVVRAGDAVELRIVRGAVAVSVTATARKDGTLGQTIPVRNELTGRLRNARVAGPGLVEWRN